MDWNKMLTEMFVVYSLHLLALVLALIYGFRKAARCPQIEVENALPQSKGLMIFCVALTVFVGVTLTAQYFDQFCRYLPLFIQGYARWITWAGLSVIVGVVTGYTLALGLSRRHPKRNLLLLLTVSLNLFLGVKTFQFVAPIAGQLGDPQISAEGVILQTEGMTCAAAGVANIAMVYGDSLNEKEAAALLLTSRMGTERGSIRYVLSRLGYQPATLEPDANKSLAGVRSPAVIFVDHPSTGPESHAVVYMGMVDQRKFEIWDPLSGKELWDDARQKKVWHGNGIFCEKERL